MAGPNPHQIDLVEVIYDLSLPTTEWLPSLFEVGLPLFDFATEGYTGILTAGTSAGTTRINQMHVGLGREDIIARAFVAAQQTPREVIEATTRQGFDQGVLIMRDIHPAAYRALADCVGCEDGVGVYAMDPNGDGVFFSLFSDQRVDWSDRDLQSWKKLGVHLAAGQRLRRGLGQVPAGQRTFWEVTEAAEAMIDPSRFVATEASGPAKNKDALEEIREAAKRVDRARGRLRKSNPEEALGLWHGLVRGRWSLVDWFDTDGRRFVLARPNSPNLGDPRGLTRREHQVATYAARGETGTLIAYRFGISQQRVSGALSSAMRKLRVKTQAQLVEKMRGMPRAAGEDEAS